MPTYAFYPQGRALNGLAVEARLADDEAAFTQAAEVMAGHPDAHEVSIWCGERYVGRLPVPPPATPPKPAATAGLAAKPKRAPRRRSGGGPAKA